MFWSLESQRLRLLITRERDQRSPCCYEALFTKKKLYLLRFLYRIIAHRPSYSSATRRLLSLLTEDHWIMTNPWCGQASFHYGRRKL